MSSAMSGLLGALGGGGAPPPDPSGGLGGGPSGSPDDTSTGGEQYNDPVEALDAADQALHAYIQMEPDDSDRAVAAQCLQQIIKLKAKDSMDLQKLHSALQGAPVGPPPGPPQGPMG